MRKAPSNTGGITPLNREVASSHDSVSFLTQLEAMIDQRVEAALRKCGVIGTRRDCRSIRIVRGLTISDAAMRAGISHVALGKIESGKTRNPSPQTLNKIARALNVPESDYREAFMVTNACNPG